MQTPKSFINFFLKVHVCTTLFLSLLLYTTFWKMRTTIGDISLKSVPNRRWFVLQKQILKLNEFKLNFDNLMAYVRMDYILYSKCFFLHLLSTQYPRIADLYFVKTSYEIKFLFRF